MRVEAPWFLTFVLTYFVSIYTNSPRLSRSLLDTNRISQSPVWVIKSPRSRGPNLNHNKFVVCLKIHRKCSHHSDRKWSVTVGGCVSHYRDANPKNSKSRRSAILPSQLSKNLVKTESSVNSTTKCIKYQKHFPQKYQKSAKISG